MREATRKHLEGLFLTGWATTPPFPVFFENQKPKEERPAWGRFFIRLGETIPAACGRRHSRTPGYFGLQIFLADESGTKPANLAADKLGALFQFTEQRIAGENGEAIDVVVESGVTGPEFKGSKDGWAQYHATFRLRVDVITAPTP